MAKAGLIGVAAFNRALNRFMRDIDDKVAGIVKRKAGAVLRNAIDASPVNTGRLAANWNVGVNKEPPPYSKDRRNPKATLREGLGKIARVKIGDIVIIGNDTRYIFPVLKKTPQIRRAIDEGIAK